MARFWIMSDLHQEYAENAVDLMRPDVPFDAVLVAGDVCGPLPDALAWLRRQLPDDRLIYVAGNHDYWQPSHTEDRLTLPELLDAGRDAARVHGVDLLDDATVTVAGARICGATLWTDYRLNNGAGAGTAHWMRAAERGMTDYGRIRRPSSTRPTRPIRPTDLLMRHRASVAWLDATMATPFDGPTVVVTHHAPTPLSLSDENDTLAHCYASDLTWLIERHAPALWVHGHVHGRVDVQVDNTRVLANARGHAGCEASAAAWVPQLVVEV